jgi:hypothetical protein
MEEFSVRIAEIERKLHDAQRDRDNFRAKYEEAMQHRHQQPSSDALIAEKDGQVERKFAIPVFSSALDRAAH